MSGSYLYKNQEAKYDYIADVFNTLIVRDIRKKYKIRNTQLMDRIVDFLMDNVSNLSSARNITQYSGKHAGEDTPYDGWQLYAIPMQCIRVLQG